MSRLLALSLLTPATALAVDLEIGGDCPGPVAIEASDVTPGGSVFFVAADRAGADAVPGGSCAGTPLGVDVSGAYGPFNDADGDGVVAAGPTVGPAVCDKAVVVLDIATCDVSEPAGFRGQGKCAPGEHNAWIGGTFETGLILSTERSVGGGEFVIDTASAEGTYSVEMVNGSAYVRQTFDPPVPVLDLTDASWSWQADPSDSPISSVTWSYSDGTTDSELFFSTAWTGGWDFVDLVPYLDPSKELASFRIYGYSGGGSAPDYLRVDDLRFCH